DQFMGLRIAVGFRIDSERRAIDRAPESVPNMERVVRPKASIVDGFADREQDRDLHRARRMETTLGVYRKAKAGLVIMNCDRGGCRLALAEDAFAFGSEGFDFRFVVHRPGPAFSNGDDGS